MGDVQASSPVLSKVLDNPADGSHISWNNSSPDAKYLNLEEAPTDEWRVSLSPHEATTINSSWKDLVKATSPIVSSYLSTPKEQSPVIDIDIKGDAVKKLTSDAETLVKSKSSESADKQKSKAQRGGDNAVTTTKQTSKSKMMAEISRRRRLKADEEKRQSKQVKDDSSRNSKSCTVCGVPMADGPRTICRGCVNRQRRDKSREKNSGKESKNTTRSSPQSSPKEDDTNPSDADSQSKESSCLSSPTENLEVPREESPTRSRSMEITESVTETITKFAPHKRTSTDLGPGSFTKYVSPKKTALSKAFGQASPAMAGSGTSGLALPLNQTDALNSRLSRLGTHVMKRSTTDSQIVSKGKMITKPETRVDGKQQHVLEEAKKRVSPKLEKKDGSTQSSQIPETGNSGMKLERSKTVLGKMNALDPEKTMRDRKKEGSNLSAESEKSFSHKKYTNPARSHTTIGDGLNKRPRGKGEWSRFKAGKADSSSGSKDKELKKKGDKKNSSGDDDERKVNFIEGETVKEMKMEEAIMTSVDNSMPSNLYDYVQEYSDDSSSENESDAETSSDVKEREMALIQNGQSSIVNRHESPSTSRSEIPEAIRSRGVPFHNAPRTRAQGVDSELEANDISTKPASKYGQSYSGRADSSSGRSEATTNNKISRWSEEAFIAAGHEDWVAYEDQESDDEEEDPEGKSSVYSEEIEYESDPEDSDQDSTVDIYTGYPSKPEKGREDVENQIDSPVNNSYYTSNPTTSDDGNSRQMVKSNTEEEKDQLYTTGSHVLPTQYASEDEVAFGFFGEQEDRAILVEYTESNYTGTSAQAMIGNGDSAQTYFNAYETDVDTGLSVLRPQNEIVKSSYGNAWGFFRQEDHDSSSSSEDEDHHINCSDSWYTGGYLEKSKSSDSQNNDDLVYFDDKAGKDLNDSDLYTGELFSSAVAKGNSQKDMSMNNNITLEDTDTDTDILFEGSNFWILSSRPQMYSDVSNNNNDDDERNAPGLQGRLPIQIACKSDYTEYAPTLMSNTITIRPKKEMVLLGRTDFRKYDRQDFEERSREERVTLRTAEPPRGDTLFFGDEPPKIPKPQIGKPQPESHGLYFNKSFAPVLCSDPSPEIVRHHLPKDEDYQGGFFYATRYESNNNNNLNTNNNNNECENDSYTGCFRNEEEYKPTHDGLFNDKASSFVFQRRSRDPVTPLYFNNVSSKSYYDGEESVYAFEKKKEKIVKPPEPPKIMKIGSIVVRNNVECEVDYAQNIDMDSQDVPKTWMRYNYGDDTNVHDTSSYAQNVSYEEFGGAKPWVMEGTRAPWKVSKEKKSKDKNGANGNWTPTPDSKKVEPKMASRDKRKERR